MRPIICFIDDSEFEHELVRHEIASHAPDIEFIQAYTFEEARKELSARLPSLFLLDLWGKDEDILDPSLAPKSELENKISKFPTLDNVYDGLDRLTGDAANEYLKRLFSIVDSWRTMFEEVCSRIGQNRRYGLANLGQVREYYPGVPAVFYTRKSLINDAVAIFKAGADGLLIKPTGPNDAQTRRLTREYAPQLIIELKEFLGSKPNRQ